MPTLQVVYTSTKPRRKPVAVPTCEHCFEPIRETYDLTRNEYEHMDGLSHCYGGHGMTRAKLEKGIRLVD